MDIEELKIKLGLRLAALRKSKGLNQEDIEKQYGFAYRHYGKIERGQANATLETLLKLCDIFDVNMADLFCFDAAKSDAQHEIAASIINILNENDEDKLNKLRIFLKEIL